MTLLGNAVQLSKFALAQCGGIEGRKHDSRKAKGKRMKLFPLIGWEQRQIYKLVTAKFSGYKI